MKSFWFMCWLLVGSVISTSCTAPTAEKTISTHDDGSPKVVRTVELEGTDSIPVFERVYHSNGSISMEGALNSAGERSGKWKAYYPDGTLWSEGEFKKGKRHGGSNVYHQNGQLRSSGQYKDGKQSGSWKFWNEQGKLIEEKKYPD